MRLGRIGMGRGAAAVAGSGRDGLVTAAFLAAMLGLAIFAVVQSLALHRALCDNDAIRALASGQSVPLREAAPGPLLRAAAAERLARGRITEAEALAPKFRLIDDRSAAAAFHTDLGNARMRAAFDLIEANEIDDATVTIRLAQEDYRRAMRLVPEDFDVKFNFDLASRLVRVFPRPAIEPEEEGKRPRDVWTDLPGVPRGLP